MIASGVLSLPIIFPYNVSSLLTQPYKTTTLPIKCRSLPSFFEEALVKGMLLAGARVRSKILKSYEYEYLY